LRVPRLITADQIDFGPKASTPVVSDTLRFVIPVPAFKGGGEPLEPPQGSGPFLDWAGKPITGSGVVFYNPDDRCYQAAQGDGKEVVIFGLITQREAKQLAAATANLAADPNKLTLAQFKSLLQFAAEDMGQIAIYNSARAAVESTMVRAGPDTGIADFGLYRRSGQDLCDAVFVPGDGVFQGPAATPQEFTDGAVIIRQGDDVHLVQTTSFEATYKHPDGSAILVSELVVQSPK
jgi:hypothetical protein